MNNDNDNFDEILFLYSIFGGILGIFLGLFIGWLIGA
jgi:hypothetical protein